MQISFDIEDWAVVGGGQWDITDEVISQLSIGESDPQDFYYNKPSGSQSRTVLAKVIFDDVADPENLSDGRVGISILNNGTVGIGLVYSDNAGGLIFVEELSAWGSEPYYFLPDVDSQWWFKGMFNSATSTFYGKCWEDGSDEPEAWQVTFSPLNLNGTFVHSGVIGNSPDMGITRASFSDFSIQPVTEPQLFVPYFKPKSRLLGSGLNNV